MAETASRRRVLVATGDVLTERMAGPAIRAWEIAATLAREHDVRLVTTQTCAVSHDAFDARGVSRAEFDDAVRWAEIVVFQGILMAAHPVLQKPDRIVIADIYDPFHLEVLEQTRDLAPLERNETSIATNGVLNQQLARGDFFLCASPKQRDFWLGQLAGVGRVNPATYDESANLGSLIAVVPFGVGDDPPERVTPRLKGVVPGIGLHDRVILWGGGIYNWFDPLTLLRAVDQLRHDTPEVRLFFLGLAHPNPHVGEMRMAVETRELAAELSLVGTHVFFNEDWVPYEQRQDYLLDADLGVSTHFDHIETEFSFRTRLLDYLWAGLPIVATGGDSLAERIEAAGAGVTVPPEDVGALTEALHAVLADRDAHARRAAASRALAEELRWSKVLEPLVEFCRAPRHAPDLLDPVLWSAIGDPRHKGPSRGWWRHNTRAALARLRRGDVLGLALAARRRVERTRDPNPLT